jgi:hypothetical protein
MELLTTVYSLNSFSHAEIDAAFAYSRSITSSEKHAAIAAAKVMYFLDAGDVERATRELESCRAEGLDFREDLSIVEKRVGAFRQAHSC